MDKKMDKKIGIFDSGLGGLSILKELIKILPNETFLLYEDSVHNPYGEKTDEELLKIADNVVKFLLKENCKIIVIACNTITISCLDELRKMYPDVIFVGTVPAVKVAYNKHCKNTIILSTPYTMKSKRLNELIDKYHRVDQNIINISGENLANLIESDNKVEIMNLLGRLLGKYKDKVDSLVLGCTHYSLIKEEINQVLPDTVLLDGCVGVSREVKHQLEEHNLLSNNKDRGSVRIVNSKNKELIERSFKILWS